MKIPSLLSPVIDLSRHVVILSCNHYIVFWFNPNPINKREWSYISRGWVRQRPLYKGRGRRHPHPAVSQPHYKTSPLKLAELFSCFLDSCVSSLVPPPDEETGGGGFICVKPQRKLGLISPFYLRGTILPCWRRGSCTRRVAIDFVSLSWGLVKLE